jgi:Flp pilus assembly protein TadD
MDESLTSSLMHQAEALLELGRPHEALHVAGMAAAAEPPAATIHCVMATGHLALGEVAQAFVEIKRAMQLDQAFEWPHRLHAMALLQRAEHARGRRARRLQKWAVVAARRAATLDPTIPEAHCILGFAALTLGRVAEARAATRRAVELEPDAAAGWVVVSLVELSEGQWAAAAYAAARALTLDPEEEAAATVLESAYRQLGCAVLPDSGQDLSWAS